MSDAKPSSEEGFVAEVDIEKAPLISDVEALHTGKDELRRSRSISSRLLRSRSWLLLLPFLILSLLLAISRSRYARHHLEIPENVKFSPWCDCPGVPLVPVPRLDNTSQMLFQTLNMEVQAADQGEKIDILFYGDSIFESWRGTALGGSCGRCAGIPDVFHRNFASKYSTEVLAIACDQTSHLLWRLQNGQLFMHAQPRVMVVLIGTNDLGGASCWGKDGSTIAANGTAARIVEALELLQYNNPQSQIISLAILPRGYSDGLRPYEWPSGYAAGIEIVNTALQKHAAQQERIQFLDCSAYVLPDGKIEPELMPDGLHPSAAGMELLASCFAPLVDELMANHVTLSSSG